MRKIAFVFFLLGIVGTLYLCWFVYAAALRPSLERKWIQIPTPAEALISLSLDETGNVLAESEAGNLYQFYSYPKPVWKKTSRPENIHPGATCGPIEYSGYTSLPLAGEVKSHVSEACGFAEQTNYLEVSLLANGETWYLETSNNSYVTIGLILFIPIGLVIDAAIYGIGFIFLLIDFMRKQRQKEKQVTS